MSGTKILVLHLKEIIRAVVFTVFGIILLFAIIYFFIAQDQPATPEASLSYSPSEEISLSTFIAGTYFAEIPLNFESAGVEVTVTENEIVNIVLTELSDNHQTFYPLLSPTLYSLAQEIIESQSLEVTMSYENAVTSTLLVDAISRALHEATLSES